MSAENDANRIVRVEERIIALREAVSAAQRNSEIALTEAKRSIDERLKLLNELRSLVEGWGRDFLLTSVYSAQHDSLVEKVDILTRRITVLESVRLGKEAGVSTIGLVVVGSITVLAAIGGFVVSILNFFRHP